MKFFLDTADVQLIEQTAKSGLVDGVTTNPSLIAQAVAKDPGTTRDSIVQSIAAIVDGPISAEVISTETEAMLAEGKALAGMHKNIVVKLPMIPAALPVIHELTQNGIAVNVTLLFSVNQALLAAKAGATFVSPFVGRIDDTGEDGMNLVRNIVHVFQTYGFTTQVLAASIRHPLHVAQAAEAGAHAVTMPIAVFNQLAHHPLTDVGLAKFLADSQTHS